MWNILYLNFPTIMAHTEMYHAYMYVHMCTQDYCYWIVYCNFHYYRWWRWWCLCLFVCAILTCSNKPCTIIQTVCERIRKHWGSLFCHKMKTCVSFYSDLFCTSKCNSNVLQVLHVIIIIRISKIDVQHELNFKVKEMSMRKAWGWIHMCWI